MESTNKFKAFARDKKVKMAIGLLVTTAGLVAHHDSKSYVTYCTDGPDGDCVRMTDGNKSCSSGWFWNDCL